MLVRKLATRRKPTPYPEVRYRPDTQTSEVFEDDRWVSSWQSETVPKTKKADVETGEDQKGT